MKTISVLHKSLCTGCSACAQRCPTSSIVLCEDEEGFLYPKVDEAACLKCGLCLKVCPVIAGIHADSEPAAYAARCKDDAIRNASSSGGIFTLLAEEILAQGGVVIGAGFDDTFDVVHMAVEDKDQLARLRGSKYVQSRIGNTYQQARCYLEEGRKVYFSGTPCQIEGLLKFLGKPYDGLITQDIVCHGVPSPMIWRKYVAEAERKNRSSLCQVSFRHKVPGWRRYSIRMSFCNGKKYEQIRSKDPYMRSYLADLNLRPSCYYCMFKTINRASDLTLADFWGIQEIYPQLDDDRGASLVICHTPRGRALFEQIKNNADYVEADLKNAVEHNQAICKSASRPQERDAFLQQMRSQPFEKVAKRFCRVPSIPERAVRKLHRIMRNIFGRNN